MRGLTVGVVVIVTGCSFRPAGLGPADEADGPTPELPDAAAGTADVTPLVPPDAEVNAPDAMVAAPDATPPPPDCPGDTTLVACWRFEGTTLDSTPNANHASQLGVTFEPGLSGLAVRSSEAAMMTVPDSASLDADTEVTVEGWVFLDDLPPEEERIGVLDNNGQYSIFVGGAGDVRCSAGGASHQSPAGSVITGGWFHLACVHSEILNTIEIYVNGVDVGGGAMNGDLGTGNTDGTTLAANSPCDVSGCADIVDGLVDTLRVWSRALTAAEISAIVGGG